MDLPPLLWARVVEHQGEPCVATAQLVPGGPVYVIQDGPLVVAWWKPDRGTA